MEEEEEEEEVEKAERAMEVEARAAAAPSSPPPPSSKLRARAKEELRAERLWEDWGTAVPVPVPVPVPVVPVAAAEATRDGSRGGSVPLGASHTMEKVLVCGEKDRARAGRHRALPSPAKSRASAPHPAATQSSPLWESSSMSTK